MPFNKDLFTQWRKKAGYSQRKIAMLLSVSNQTISSWEHGVMNPTIEHLDEIHQISQQTDGYKEQIFYETVVN